MDDQVDPRPPGACLTHRNPRPGHPWRRADTGYTTCHDCHTTISHWLTTLPTSDQPDSIPTLWAQLDTTPHHRADTRRGPGYGSRAPASNHIIAMRDPRSRPHPTTPIWYGADGRAYTEPDYPVLSIPGTLTTWVRLVAEQRGVTPTRGTVPDLCAFLLRHLDWLTRQTWITELHDDLAALRAQLRAATGHQGQPPVGHCIELQGDGVECGSPIFMPPGAPPRAPDEPVTTLPELICPACGSRYNGRRLIVLRLGNSSGKRSA